MSDGRIKKGSWWWKSQAKLAGVGIVGYVLLGARLILGNALPLVPGERILSWEYNQVTENNLPRGFEWVQTEALNVPVDDEGAWAYLVDVCGDETPEVVFLYWRDRYITANEGECLIYAKSSRRYQRITQIGYFLEIGFGQRWRCSRSIWTSGWGLQAARYVYCNETYQIHRASYPLALLRKTMGFLTLQFFKDPLLAGWILVFLTAHFSLSTEWRVGPSHFGRRWCRGMFAQWLLFLFFGTLCAIIGFGIPAFMLAGPFITLGLIRVVRCVA